MGTAPETVAVIDIGSNSGRVVVYRYQAGGHLHLLAGSRASLRLVRDLDASHRLSQEALGRAWEAVLDFRAIAAGAGAQRILAVATAATRSSVAKAACALLFTNASCGRAAGRCDAMLVAAARSRVASTPPLGLANA